MFELLCQVLHKDYFIYYPVIISHSLAEKVNTQGDADTSLKLVSGRAWMVWSQILCF